MSLTSTPTTSELDPQDAAIPGAKPGAASGAGSNLSAFLLAGVIGELAFELYAWLLSPLLFGLSLQPAKLVMALGSIYGGVTLPYGVAFAIHATIGVLGFGGFVWLARRISAQNPWVVGIVTGVILWVVAQGVLAPMVGRSFMMGFGPYTQSSFIGHVGMTLIVAQVLARYPAGLRRA